MVYDSSNAGSVRCRGRVSTIYADFKRIELNEPPSEAFASEEELDQWIWENHRDEIRAAMTIKYENQQTELEKAQQSLTFLDKVAQVQRQYLQSEGPKVVYGCLLEGLLDLMDSEYGFIGEIKHEEDGTMFLQTHASTNIAWNEATQKFYEENAETGIKFYNMDTLFGTVMTTGKPVISNNPEKDKRSGGIPEGHPSLDYFLGIPFFKKGGEAIGMMAIANKPGGYTEDDIEYLEPFTVTCSNLIQAYWQIQENKRLINTLEEKVEGRTHELLLANECLEDANKRVVSASALQLQHFACMSHEIRTPLNCVIGLSSLLQETKLDPMQEESMRMIVNSGDLLLTVVNDVLDYSKLETGNVDIELERSSLQETLNAFVHSIEMKALSSELSVQTFYDTALPEFFTTDSRRLQQIMYNLLGNAIKFSKNGGVVEFHVSLCDANAAMEESFGASTRTFGSVHTEPESFLNTTPKASEQSRCPFHRSAVSSNDPSQAAGGTASSGCPFQRPSTATSLVLDESSLSKGEFEIQCERPMSTGSASTDKILRFVVKDYGKGIAMKDFERIFKPFQQSNTETERVYGGTGLGLAITAKLVHALGGTVSVDSEEDKWSEFTVDFPFPEAPADIESISHKLSRATVLLVHEESESLEQVKAVFRQYKVDLVHFKNIDDMDIGVAKDGFLSPSRIYICLADEDLYCPEPFELLSNMATSMLLTFGPKFSVKESTCHYRSLVQMLPSVLLESTSDQVQALAQATKADATEDVSMVPNGPQAVPYSEKLRVLIAEDNKINQKVLVRMLKRLKIENVDVVDNGQQAVDAEASREYDVVLMDMQMPVMDGIEACRLICARHGGHAKAGVIFVTAQASSSFAAECSRAGSVGFLAKPFNLRAIETSLQDFCLSRTVSWS